MDYDSYLMKFYGINTQDTKYKRTTPRAKRLLRDSYAMDTQKENDDKQLATLYPSNKQSN